MWSGKVSNAINTIISTKFYKPNFNSDLFSHCRLLRMEKVYIAVTNIPASTWIMCSFPWAMLSHSGS